mgnify:CR=1 FL=1
MLCERCKIREANIQYTEIVNGVRKEHNFCAQCARELDFGPYSTDANIPLSRNVLANTIGTVKGAGAHTRAEWVDLKSLPAGLGIVLSLMNRYLD